MYLAVFALFSVVGAWVAWRSNPLYSNRETLRFVSIVGLAVAAVIGAIAAAVDLTADRSATVAMGTLFGVCLVCTIALIWVIVKVSTPATAALPAAAKLVDVHQAKLYPWARRFGWMLVGLTILVVSLPPDGKLVVYALGGAGVFIGIVCLFAGYIAARGLDRSLTAVELHPWVHWRYTPEQWEEWTDVQVARTLAAPQWRRDWKRLAIPLVAVAAGVFAFDPGTWPLKAVYVAACWGTIAGVIALANRDGETAPRRVRRRLMNAAPEAYFGAGGVFAGGVYTQWQTFGDYLLEGAVDERRPRSLVFRFEHIVPGASGTSTEVRRSVLIPADADGDIARLKTALSAECPSARIMFS